MFDRTWVVVKREFVEGVRSKMFLIGTLLAPILMIAMFALPILLVGGAAGERSIAVVDATDEGIGERVVASLPAPGAASGGTAAELPIAGEADGRAYRAELIGLDADRADADSVRAALTARIAADELDGFVWLPAGLLADERAVYEGENATNSVDVRRIRTAVETAVREHRMREAGIDPAQVAAALRPVGLDARKTGENTATGSAGATTFLAFVLGTLTYIVVMMWGQAVLRGVLEEKRDRIIEILASSIRIRQLMMGKVIGIGATGLLQVGIWTALAAVALSQGDALMARFGAELPELPRVPARVGLVFLLCFLGGYFLYAALFAIAGAIVTSDQDAHQVVFPVMLPILAGFLIMMFGVENPDGTTMIVGSIVPFTSPIVMPTRLSLVDVPALELLASLGLLAGTALACVWVAGKIYRIGMLATGTRPSLADLVRWVRTA